MIVYLAEKTQFLADVDSNKIDEVILSAFQRTHHKSVGDSERKSWKNSMGFMQRILSDRAIPSTAGIAIEFGIPQTAKRIDFIVTGRNAQDHQTAIIVELKQWTDVQPTKKDAIVKTFIGSGERETEHPSYQAWSYAALLEDFNEAVREQEIALKPCAYLHNCATGATINSDFYAEHTQKAPAFLRDDAEKLRTFIRDHVKKGDSGGTIYQIRDGKISPSKNLADRLASLLQGNKEFLMIDDQKLVYETALELAAQSASGKKNVLIVNGGPGTGKSVVAINLLVELTARESVVQYVTRNAAPRDVYQTKLTGTMRRNRINFLFRGSGSYTETAKNTFDALIIDEAHRLNEKSGMYQNLGENQIKELITSAKLSVFFLDENQKVTFRDIGDREEIQRWAKSLNAEVTELALESQFRCNGSDGYLAWVDHTMGIRETANPTLEGIHYEFRVCDSPKELQELIFARNKLNNKARMVAGYCWDWKSKKSPDSPDIEIPEHGFSAQWNLADDGNLWIMNPESVQQVGCIHTCQGLELDYIGVIIGPDFLVRDGEIQTDAKKRSRMDASIKGYGKMLKASPDKARKKADEIIKNTYRTLMTRGQKGCFVFSVDPETNQYLRDAVGTMRPPVSVPSEGPYDRLPLRILEKSEVLPFQNAVPVYDLRVAAGGFSDHQAVEDCDWVELPEPFLAREGYFVARVVGESMNRRIPNGSWCLFRKSPEGSRQGKIVLVQLRDRQDADSGGQFTVKLYSSEKHVTGDTWAHARITLRSDSDRFGYTDIILEANGTDEFSVVGEFVAVLGYV